MSTDLDVPGPVAGPPVPAGEEPASPPPTGPGWLVRALLCGAVVAVVALTVLPWPGPIVTVLVAGAGAVVLVTPGGYATGVLVAAVAVGVGSGSPEVDVRLAAQAALLPLVGVASALAGAVPATARVEWAALRPSGVRVAVAAATAVVLARVAAATPAATGAGAWLAVVGLAVAGLVVGGLLAGRHRSSDAD